MMMIREINFDMDGTLANFYEVENWLDYLMAGDTTPYEIAKPLFNFSSLARILNRLQRNGYKINIISWLAKSGDDNFMEAIAEVKKAWLAKHLPSVVWDEINIVAYGTPKSLFGNGILFDDEEPNREEWRGIAYDVDNILEILKGLK